MSFATLRSAVVMAAFVVLASTVARALPAGRSHSHRKSADIYIFNPAQIPDGPALKPGNYRITVMDSSDAPQVAFYSNDNLVGKTTAQLVSEQKAPDHTSVRYLFRDQNDPIVSEIDVKGWTQRIVFSPAK